MVKRPVVIPGCLLRKFSPEKLVQGVRQEDYCKDDCTGCGFNVMEEARRKQLLRAGGLEKGTDGVRRLYLGAPAEPSEAGPTGRGASTGSREVFGKPKTEKGTGGSDEDGLKRLYLGPKILREPSDDKEAES